MNIAQILFYLVPLFFVVRICIIYLVLLSSIIMQFYDEVKISIESGK